MDPAILALLARASFAVAMTLIAVLVARYFIRHPDVIGSPGTPRQK
jgi:hypothetical protein